MPVRVPLILPKKEAAILSFRLITTYPRPTHPITYQSYPLVSCPKVGTFGYQDHQEKRYSTPDSGSQLRLLVDG